MADIPQAIIALYPDAEFSGPKGGSGYEAVRWIKKPSGITEAKVLNKLAELQAAYDAQEYARKREAEYPTVQELVVALYDTDDKSAIEAKRAEIKAKYPKG